MSAQTELVVLITSDFGLRGVLTAQLSLQGEDVMTIDCSPRDPRLDKVKRRPAILIVDALAVEECSYLIDPTTGWNGIIVLGDHDAPARATERVCVVDRKAAASGVIATLARWRCRAP